ncbi:hypothetical protein NHJ13051_003989 [Beauveria bassiana]
MPVYGRNDTIPDDVPELDFDLSTITESEPKTNFDDSPETDDEDGEDDQDDQDDGDNEDNEDNDNNDNNYNDQDESHDQDDDFEPEYDGYDSGYEAEAEFESDDEEYDDDSEQEDQDSESDGNHFSAIDRLIEQLDLLRLKVEMYAARRAARTNPVNSLSRHSNVRPAYEGFVIDVSHLDIYNNAPQSTAGAGAATTTVVVVVSPLAGQHNEPVRCAISFRWWLTGCEHAEYSVPIVLYVLVCDYLTVLAGAVLCATLRALARALLCSPRGVIIIVRPPLSGVSFVWLKHAPPMVTAVSVALDAIAADESGRLLRRRGCRAWTALPVFQLRREWAGARRQFVVVSFTSFAVLSLVHVAICSFGITAAVEGSEIGGG